MKGGGGEIMPKQFWTVREAALALRIHPETLRQWIRQGRLRATLKGARKDGYRIAIADLEPLFEELAEKERQREEAMLQQGIPVSCEFIESAPSLRIDGGKSLPYPPLLADSLASDQELLDYVDTCFGLIRLAHKELERRLKESKH